MNACKRDARISPVARASHVLGCLALFMLLLSGYGILSAILGPDSSAPQHPARANFMVSGLWLVLGQGTAGLAALAALILGIIALVDIAVGAGKLEGRGLAVSGLVTGTVTGLTVALVYGVLPLIAARALPKLESSNNLKTLGLALVEYNDAYRRLPPAVLRDPRLGDRAQPYSWRVAILPFLGEEQLYAQYRRDEAWDSPANKALLAKMPRVFAPHGSGGAVDGLTHYQVVVGPGTTFERPDSAFSVFRPGDFPRGEAHTILLVEAADPVPWTKPEDLAYTPGGPMPKVGGLVGKGFHVLFADGTVCWFEADEQENVLRTLVLRNGP
jgi:hypothetical protein